VESSNVLVPQPPGGSRGLSTVTQQASNCQASVEPVSDAPCLLLVRLRALIRLAGVDMRAGCKNLTTHQADTACQDREDGESLLAIDGAGDHRRHCGACRVVLVTQRGSVANLHQFLRPRSELAEPNHGPYHCRPSRMMMMAGSTAISYTECNPDTPITPTQQEVCCRSVPNQTPSRRDRSRQALLWKPSPPTDPNPTSMTLGYANFGLVRVNPGEKSMHSPSRPRACSSPRASGGLLGLLGLCGGSPHWEGGMLAVALISTDLAC
jgi:hypothetical protein